MSHGRSQPTADWPRSNAHQTRMSARALASIPGSEQIPRSPRPRLRWWQSPPDPIPACVPIGRAAEFPLSSIPCQTPSHQLPPFGVEGFLQAQHVHLPMSNASGFSCLQKGSHAGLHTPMDSRAACRILRPLLPNSMNMRSSRSTAGHSENATDYRLSVTRLDNQGTRGGILHEIDLIWAEIGDGEHGASWRASSCLPVESSTFPYGHQNEM